MKGKKVWRVELLTDVRKVAREVGHCPTATEYERLGKYSTGPVYRNFGTWKGFIDAAGLQYKGKACAHAIPTDEEVVRDMKRVARLVGHTPIETEYRQHGRYHIGSMERRAGVRTWAEVCAKHLGVDIEEVKVLANYGGKRYRTTKERLDELRALGVRLKRAPSFDEATKNGIALTALRGRLNVTWDEILKMAGLDPSQKSKYALTQQATDEMIIADIVRVARYTGRIPTRKEYMKRGQYGTGGLKARLGWKRVKALVRSHMGIAVRPMQAIPDATRDRFKADSVEAVKGFFSNNQKAAAL